MSCEYIQYIRTVKPLHNKPPRDRNKCSLYQGVHCNRIMKTSAIEQYIEYKVIIQWWPKVTSTERCNRTIRSRIHQF